jgi:hypothetical protein
MASSKVVTGSPVPLVLAALRVGAAGRYSVHDGCWTQRLAREGMLWMHGSQLRILDSVIGVVFTVAKQAIETCL